MSAEPGDSELVEEAPSGRGPARFVWIALIVILVLVGVGTIGQISGAGWFGHRTILYGTGELYALNMSDEPLYVSVDGRERVEVPAQNAQLVELVGGESQVVVTDADGERIGTHVVEARDSHALLKLTDAGCLAAVDITPYYGGKRQEKLEFVEFLERTHRVWVPGSRNVVWPRKSFPRRLAGGEGPGVWVELVACELLEEPEFLDAYLSVRLEERLKAARGENKS